MKLLGTFHPREYTNLYTSTEEASVLIHLITFRSKNNQNYKKKKKKQQYFRHVQNVRSLLLLQLRDAADF